jgi:hypothetical protein
MMMQVMNGKLYLGQVHFPESMEQAEVGLRPTFLALRFAEGLQRILQVSFALYQVTETTKWNSLGNTRLQYFKMNVWKIQITSPSGLMR